MEILRRGSVGPDARVVKLDRADRGNRESVATMHADARSWIGFFVGASLAGLATAVGHIGTLVYLMDVHPGVAGWVQAVGSVLAILAGFEVARQAVIAADVRERRANEKRLLESRQLAVILADMAETRLRRAIGTLKVWGNGQRKASWLIVQRTIEADAAVMATLNVQDLEHRAPIQTFSLIRGLLLSAADIVASAVGGDGDRKTRAAIAATAIADLEELFDLVERLAVRLPDELFGPEG
jgi:hypothetical protein